jgi:O-antigen ligase
MGLDVIYDYPFFGVGPDLFDKYFFVYAPSRLISTIDFEVIKLGRPHPHNFFLYFFAENGILGLLTAVSFFVVFFFFAIKSMKLTRNVNKDYFVLSTVITGIGIGIFIKSFLEVNGYLGYGYLTLDLPFWLMFVIIIYIYQKYSGKLPEELNIKL